MGSIVDPPLGEEPMLELPVTQNVLLPLLGRVNFCTRHSPSHVKFLSNFTITRHKTEKCKTGSVKRQKAFKMPVK